VYFPPPRRLIASQLSDKAVTKRLLLPSINTYWRISRWALDVASCVERILRQPVHESVHDHVNYQHITVRRTAHTVIKPALCYAL
jgi:hypothetical protein